ncbi:MAG: hypothetical protein N4A33_01865 [Bacteriovoracaceae bacterium]|jgi:plasmid maintenance system antidote protein VapI|nr:hypothetical protein [Bacteriovoracaceae bacterium]
MEYTSRVSVFGFDNSTDYFIAFIKDQKEQNTRFRITRLAEQLELSNTGEVSNIIKGRRKVTYRVIENMKKLVNYSKVESEYLDLIFELDKGCYSDTVTRLISKEVENIKRNSFEGINKQSTL